MSYILGALKKAEQRKQRRKTSKLWSVDPGSETPEWQVTMVSPVRYRRFRPEPGKTVHLPKRTAIAVAALTLLIFFELAVVYDVRTRMSGIGTEIGKLTRQISRTEARKALTERERISLKQENDSLKQKLEYIVADLERTRDTLDSARTKKKRQASKQRQPAVSGKEKPGKAPVLSPLMSSTPLASTETYTAIGSAETATARVYSIR